MTKEERLVRWNVLADKAGELCKAIFENANYGSTDEMRLVKFAAIQLMCRTLGNFSAMRLLLSQGYIVEARTLARCCFENMFWMSGLDRGGSDFVKRMGDDRDAADRAMGLELLGYDTGDSDDPERDGKFKAHVDELVARQGLKRITLKREADQAGYIIYRKFSGDAAHPSEVSLARHLEVSETGAPTITSLPSRREDEEEETFDFAFGAFINVCRGADSMVESKKGEELKALREECEKQSSESVANQK